MSQSRSAQVLGLGYGDGDTCGDDHDHDHDHDDDDDDDARRQPSSSSPTPSNQRTGAGAARSATRHADQPGCLGGPRCSRWVARALARRLRRIPPRSTISARPRTLGRAAIQSLELAHFSSRQSFPCPSWRPKPAPTPAASANLLRCQGVPWSTRYLLSSVRASSTFR